MDITQLKNFQAIAQFEHLTNAADFLNISQPALSVSLSRLEKELQSPLFDRVGRRIYLNESGKIFLAYVEKILLELNNAQTDIANSMNMVSKKLIIFSTNKWPLEGHFFQYKLAHPEIMLRQIDILFYDVEKALQNNECDFIVVSDCNLDHYECNCEKILEETLLVALPRTHPMAQQNSLSLSDLKDERFISMPVGHSHRDMTERLCAEAGFICNVVHETYLCHILNYVAGEIGIAIVPDTMVPHSCNYQYFRDAVSFVPIQGDGYIRKTAILWPKNRKLNKEAQSFLTFMRKHKDWRWPHTNEFPPIQLNCPSCG